MTDRSTTWLGSLEGSPEHSSLLAVIGHAADGYPCVDANRELADALQLARTELIGASLRELLGPATFDAGLREHVDGALAGRALRSRLRMDLPGRPRAVLESLLMPAPAGSSTTAPGSGPSVLWIARDVSRATRLHDAYLDLSRRVASGRSEREALERDVARHLALATGSERVEVWRRIHGEDRAERAAVYSTSPPGGATRRSPMNLTEHLAALDGGRPFAWPGPVQGGAPRVPLAVPIVSGGRALGLLLLEPGASAAWSATDRRWLSEIAHLLVAAQARRDERETDRHEARVRTRAQLRSMARGIAHDFNNLLVGILGGLELAFQEAGPDPDLHDDLQLIQRSADRAARLCSSMLAYAGGRHGRCRPVELNAVVRTSVTAGQRLELEAGLEPLHADPDQVRQLVDSLVSNAIQAVEGRRGAVTVRTARTTASKLALEDTGWVLRPARPHGQFQRLEVLDQGEGIPEGMLERVFEPFFTTRPGASGLGLAAALGLVESLSGGVYIRSIPGHGTSVSVVLPEANDRADSPAVPRVEKRGPTRVLVVHDDAAVLETLSRLLREGGCDVLGASDPLLAVELFERAEPPVDAVVVDFAMPGIDGVETIERLRRIDPNVRAVLVSGYSPDDRARGERGDPSDRATARSRDATRLEPPVAFLQQPFAGADLLALLPTPVEPAGDEAAEEDGGSTGTDVP